MIKVPATLWDKGSMSDRGRRLWITTPELQPESLLEILRADGKEGWFLFKENPIKEEDVVDLPEFAPLDPKIKSPGKRLRDRMFVYYRSCHQDTKDFDMWYSSELDRIGQGYLDKTAE